jgi:signal transduction histidine kinase/DNA-binding response OmpR family regulator/HAMP domain-containing protein
VRNIAEVTTAVANGDLTKKVGVDVKGEISALKNTINAMVDQLNSFASEVTRVALEVGTEGKLGGQAQVRGVAGVWKDLTDSVNFMASNLTSQVRGIAKVVTAVANGDLKRMLIVEAKGEIAALTDTINEMINTLATFADQVTGVARAVGVEGKLGGQAKVPGAAGTWKDLTDNVNQLAANLSTQVRAIAEVATAVTKGDLTRSISVEAQGEVAALKDNINEMIRNLKDTTQKNTEQDWLKTNLARFTRMLQGERDLMKVAKLILSELAPVVSAQHGVFYMTDKTGGSPLLRLTSTYAFRERKGLTTQFKFGEGLVGQCAMEKERILVTDLPGDYVQISSGLGNSPPLNIVVLPVLFEGEVKAIVELASVNRFKDIHLTLLDQLTETIAIVLNTIEANMRTESLLTQSQSLADELTGQQEQLQDKNARLEEQAASLRASEDLLKKQQDELRRANDELERKARQLSDQKSAVEGKNREIELAKLAVQERAEQLALTSKYKSEFLANMSHELRTPLNSLLILSEMLEENADRNLTSKQLEFAQTIHSSGSDLLALINDILDMAKIESGTMSVEVGEVPFEELENYVERTFRPVAENKGLTFHTSVQSGLPKALLTDVKRLQQVLRNLLSNAFKFTDEGSVNFEMEKATEGWSRDHQTLSHASNVVAFRIRDTGIGIPADKLRIIFEPFQQAEMGTSRKFGGTGLGLSISREIARLLGGEITVSSRPGQGSTFTLFLPHQYEISSVTQTVLAAPPAVITSEPLQERSFNGEAARGEVRGDHDHLEKGDRIVLIVEDDPTFADILLATAHDKGFKGIITPRGGTAWALVEQYRPDAITLDLRLPDMDGWVLLDRLKHHPATRHIPINIISIDDRWQSGGKHRAFAYHIKPVSKRDLDAAFASLKGFVERRVKKLLVVEDNPQDREQILKLVGSNDVQVTEAESGSEALAALCQDKFDCMILDLGLPDIPGIQLLERAKQEMALVNLPVIVYTARDLGLEEERRLRELTDTIIIKDMRSMDLLLNETALFLHRVVSTLPQGIQDRLEDASRDDPIVAGKKVLVVDDDVRNIFALTSILERRQINVCRAETGQEALEILNDDPEIDLVLMDIMMPKMDGYQTIRAIRAQEKFRHLPIVALTAKAMAEDRDKCLAAGASDYLAKPVHADELFAMLRVWLHRYQEAPV